MSHKIYDPCSGPAVTIADTKTPASLTPRSTVHAHHHDDHHQQHQHNHHRETAMSAALPEATSSLIPICKYPALVSNRKLRPALTHARKRNPGRPIPGEEAEHRNWPDAACLTALDCEVTRRIGQRTPQFPPHIQSCPASTKPLRRTRRRIGMSALRSSATRYESSSARTRSSSCLRERTPRSVGVWEIHALEKILHQLCTFSPEGSGVDWRNKLQRERGNGVLRPVLLVERRKALTDLQLHDLAVFQNRLAIPQESASPFFEDLSPLHLSPRVSAMLPLPSNQTERTARFASTESDFCNAPAFSLWGQPNYEQFFRGKWVTLFCSE